LRYDGLGDTVWVDSEKADQIIYIYCMCVCVCVCVCVYIYDL